MDSGCYDKIIRIDSETKRRFADAGWLGMYLGHAGDIEPKLTDQANDLIYLLYDLADEEDPSTGEGRLYACYFLAEISARLRFSSTIDVEDAHRAAMIVFPDRDEKVPAE